MTVLAAGLFSNNNLVVGNNQIILPHTIAQFGGSVNDQLQVNFQNFSMGTLASADIILTANNGTPGGMGFLDLGIAGPNHNDPNQTVETPYDGYLTVTPPMTETGNLILGTYATGGNIVFVIQGANTVNTFAVFNNDYALFHEDIVLGHSLDTNTAATLTFADGTVQTTAAASANYANAAFALANSANAYAYASNTWLQANDASTLTTAKAFTTTANTFLQANDSTTLAAAIATAQAYTNTANTYIQGIDTAQNTSITVIQGVDNAQNTSITNIQGVDVAQNNSITIIQGVDVTQNTNISNLTSWLASNVSFFQGIENTQNTSITTIQGVDAAQNTSITVIQGVDVTQNASITASFAQANAAFSQVNVVFGVANTNANNVSNVTSWLSSNVSFFQGIENTQNTNITAVTTNTTSAFIQANAAFTKANNALANTSGTIFGGDLIVTGNLTSNVGVVNPPVVFAGSQTAITLDFTQSALQGCNIAANMVVTPSNLIAGKTVKLWVTNTSTGGGSNHTITHGLSALRSTVGATTVTLVGGQTALLEYSAFDTTVANCRVAITYQ